MYVQERELEFLQFLDGLAGHLKPMRDAEKAFRFALRGTREFFQAAHGCLAVVQAGRPHAELLFAMPKGVVWDHDLLFRFIRHQHPPVADTMLLAPIRRRGRTWAAMALARSGRPYDDGDARRLSRITALVSDAVQSMDRERMLGVRERIDRKIMEQVHPKDLFYQILDGLRSLTHYDHSSTLLIREENDSTLRIDAEQIAWRKAKSERIGLRIAVPADVRRVLESGRVYGFDREGESWREWTNEPVIELGGFARLQRRKWECRRAPPGTVHAVRTAGHAGRSRRGGQGRGTLSRASDRLRFGARRAVPFSGCNRHTESEAGGIVSRPHADRRAQACDG